MGGESVSRPLINDNGVIRPMTESELADLKRLAEQMPKPEPTPEERMNEIEAALIELAAMLAGGGA